MSIISKIFGNEDPIEKKKARLRDIFIEIIDEVEAEGRGASCKDYLLDELNSELDSHHREISIWDSNFNYTRYAHVMLYNLSFNLLTSGEFHIYRGVLNDITSPNLVGCIDKCLKYYKANGMITDDEIEEQLEILNEDIAQAG